MNKFTVVPPMTDEAKLNAAYVAAIEGISRALELLPGPQAQERLLQAIATNCGIAIDRLHRDLQPALLVPCD